MATLFITRHSGARDWAARHGFGAAETVDHLSNGRIAALEKGDQVIGTLPVQIAAAVTARGARYFHLSIDIPPDQRGRDMTADEMEAFHARVEEFKVTRV